MTDMKFEEKQQFRQKGFYVIYFILFTLLALFVYADIHQVLLKHSFGKKPAPNLVLIVTTLFLIAMLVVFYSATLETIITGKGVFVKWKPFRKRFIQFKWEDIDKVEKIDFGSVGHGLRVTPYGTVYHVGGDKALRLVLKSGRRVILGTQKPVELAEFLQLLGKIK